LKNAYNIYEIQHTKMSSVDCVHTTAEIHLHQHAQKYFHSYCIILKSVFVCITENELKFISVVVSRIWHSI